MHVILMVALFGQRCIYNCITLAQKQNKHRPPDRKKVFATAIQSETMHFCGRMRDAETTRNRLKLNHMCVM